MIRQETAAAIWQCYREIAAAQKMLEDMAAAKAEAARRGNQYEPTLVDACGYQRGIQLGVPMGANSHRLFGVSPVLAESIIRAHIAEQQSALAALNERARLELDAPAKGYGSGPECEGGGA